MSFFSAVADCDRGCVFLFDQVSRAERCDDKCDYECDIREL